ncbi:helix-turn-helix domain-containing protein [Micromonospora eburnea]|uniref:helix-turn-helix domain-containing protein n=1 Tax=Micromonospora eburnea TaxID=227316 RepID=UPI001ABFF7BA
MDSQYGQSQAGGQASRALTPHPEKVVEAARELFIAQGCGATKLQDVADRAGVARPDGLLRLPQQGHACSRTSSTRPSPGTPARSWAGSFRSVADRGCRSHRP